MRAYHGIVAGVLAAVLLPAAAPALDSSPPEPPPVSVTFPEAVRRALDNGRDVRMAKDEARIAGLGRTRAGAGRLPRIDAGGEYLSLSAPPGAFIQGREVQTAESTNWKAHVTAEQVLYDFGRTRSRVRESDARADAADVDLRMTRERIAMNAVAAFLEARRAEAIRDVARETLETARAHRKVAGDFYDEGVVAKNDLLAADVAVANAEAGHASAEVRVEISRSRLALVLGLPGDRSVAPDGGEIPVPGGSMPSLAESVAVALRTRPEIRAQEAFVHEGEARSEGAVSEFYPSFFGQGGYQYETNEYNPHKGVFSLLLGGRVNLFSGGADDAARRQAALQVSRRREALGKVRDEIALDVKAAHLAVDEAAIRRAAAEVAVVRAEENLRIQNDRYREGLAISTEVQDAQVLLSRAKVDLRNATYDRTEARFRWLLSRGELLSTLEPSLK